MHSLGANGLRQDILLAPFFKYLHHCFSYKLRGVKKQISYIIEETNVNCKCLVFLKVFSVHGPRPPAPSAAILFYMEYLYTSGVQIN